MLQYPTKSAQTAPLFLSRATRPIIYFAVGLSVGMWFLAFSVQMGISAPAQLPATQVAVYTVYSLVHLKNGMHVMKYRSESILTGVVSKKTEK